jgi:hypothetical protein
VRARARATKEGDAYTPGETHPDKLEFDKLAQAVHALGDPKQGDDNIDGRVPRRPQLVEGVHGRVDFAPHARRQEFFNLDGVGLVAHFEDFVGADKVEAGPGRLEVVDGLAHVAFRGKDESRQPFLVVLDLRAAGHGARGGCSAMHSLPWIFRVTHAFDLADFEQALEQLFVAQAGVPEDGTPRLDRFDNLVALVAREGEPGRVRVQFHRAAEGLLRARRHRVGFVEDDELVPPERERDFFLRKRLDAVSHDVDAAVAGTTGSGLGPRERIGNRTDRSSEALSSRTPSL